MGQDEREVLPPTPDVAGESTVTMAAAHGIEVVVEFKPVEHPVEPMDNDQPIQCPLPEPSILNVSCMLLFNLKCVLVHNYVSICSVLGNGNIIYEP